MNRAPSHQPSGHCSITFKVLLFTFKAPARSRRLSFHSLLVALAARLKVRGDWTFSFAGPNLWGEVLLQVRSGWGPLACFFLFFFLVFEEHFWALCVQCVFVASTKAISICVPSLVFFVCLFLVSHSFLWFFMFILFFMSYLHVL